MTIIKEFLVALGYKVDEGQLRKFDDNIAKSTRTVESLGKSMTVVTTALAAGINEMTRHLEDLYYVAQRSNTTVASLSSMRYAAQQVGVGADSITNSIANMSRTLREQPGTENILNGLGVQTRTATGEMRDMRQVYLDFVGHMKNDGLPFYVAAQRAAQFGTSGDDLLLQMQGYDKLIAKDKEYAESLKAAGVDMKDVSEKSIAFQNALGDVNKELDIFGFNMIKDFAEPATAVLKDFDELLKSINSLNDATGGWSTGLIAIGSALVTVRVAAAALRGVLGAVGIGGAAAGAAGGGGLIGGVAGMAARLSPLAAFLAAYWPSATNKGEDAAVAALQNPTKYAMDYYQKAGLTKAQAAGIVANQLQESDLHTTALGDNGLAYGISQWHPDRQANFKKFTGKDIRESTLDQQLAFTLFELRGGTEQGAGRALMGSTTAEQASSAYLSAERPLDMIGQATLRSARASRLMSDSSMGGGDASVVMNQKTEINVHGVTDPHQAGSVAAQEQTRVNGNMLRNAAGAFH